MNNKIKSTATVTWITYMNYGTYLQAYALQQTIFKLGYDNKVIDDARIIRQQQSRYAYWKRRLRRLSQVEREFIKFKKDHIVIDSGWKRLTQLKDRYDAYIAGSDQIWLPQGNVNPFFYLGFTDRYKVAYAPSFGLSECPDDMADFMRPYLNRFDRMSVREYQGVRILKEKFNIDAEVVVDPTMLLTRDEWERLLPSGEKDKSEKPYLLCYLLTYNRSYIEFVKRYCAGQGLSLKLLVLSKDHKGIAEDELYVGPIGFLDALRGAYVIMTDSFHGTLFSLIFHKEFYTFRRFRDDSSASQNSRIDDLLGRLGLVDRCLSESNMEISGVPIDYDSVDTTVSQMRDSSIRYLDAALRSDSDKLPVAYAAYASRPEVRDEAASGGAASAIATAFIKKGGLVYGCGQELGAKIRHIRVENEREVCRLAGSKYVHSHAHHIFSQMKDDLASGRNVLFIGLPCQVAGVKSMFRDFAHQLYTIDMCCHGAPSHALLSAHFDAQGLSYDADKVSFRTKDADGIRYVLNVYDRKGKCIYDRNACEDWYMTGFLTGLFFRPCCFKCPYARPERGADITLADHWAMGKSSDPQMTLKKGLSTVLVNTEKGISLLEDTSGDIVYERRPMSEALRNGQFISPSDKPADYDDFFACLKTEGYTAACRKYLPTHMRRLRIHQLKAIYYKSPLRQFIRKLLIR